MAAAAEEQEEEKEEAMGPEDRRGLLFLAAEHGRVLAAEKALESERKDPDGDVQALLLAVGAEDAARNTALHLACQFGHLDLIRVLLRRGADSSVKNAAGCTCFALAQGGAKPAVLRGVFEQELGNRALAGDGPGARQLLAAGVDPKCQYGGSRPSEWARKLGHEDVAQMLEAAEKGLPIDGLCGDAAGAADGEPAAVAEPEPAPTNGCHAEEEEEGASIDQVHISSLDMDAPPLFPLLWPLVSSTRVAEDGSAGGSVAGGPVLPLTSDGVVRVRVPPDMAADDIFRLLRPLEDTLAELVAEGCPHSPSLSSCSPSPLAAPLLVPCSGGLEEEDEEANPFEDRPREGASILLSADPRLGLVARGFRIALLPGRSSSRGCVEIAAGDGRDLRAAVEVFRQVLCMGAIDLGLRQLQLPTCILEDWPAPCGGFGAYQEPPAVFLDACSLPEASAREAFERLSAWRIGRIYVPIPASAWRLGLSGSRSAALFRRIFELRRGASALGLELVAVLDAVATEPLDCPAVARVIAQFGPQSCVGLRFRSESSAPIALDGALARLRELACSVARALGPHSGLALAVFLPARDPALLRRFVGAVRGGAAGPGTARVRVVLEGPVADSCELVAATASMSAQGMPCTWLVSADHGGSSSSSSSPPPSQQKAPARGASLPFLLPVVVWPGAGVRSRALALQDALQRACVGGALDSIVEVPVWAPPWVSPSVATAIAASPSEGAASLLAPSPPLWCSLTAFLAVGLSRSASSGAGSVAALPAAPGRGRGPGEDDCGRGGLGPLLAAQLLGAPAAGSRAGAVTAAELAELLWDPAGTATTASTAPPPGEGQMRPLLDLLAGWWRPPKANSPDEAVSIVASWYQHLYKRRQSMRTVAGGSICRSDGSVPRWALQARGHLQVALSGLEWLLLACSLSLLLLRQAAAASKPGGGGGTPRLVPPSNGPLRDAVAALPPAKRCDIQNTFLKVIELTVNQGAVGGAGGAAASGTPVAASLGTPVSPPVAAAPLPAVVDDEAIVNTLPTPELEALWRGGLRLGASLGLEPWVTFEACGP